MPAVQIRLSPELHESLIAECERRDISIADITRRFYESLVDRSLSTPTPGLARQVAALPRRKAVTGIRGFALDGSPISHDTRARPK